MLSPENERGIHFIFYGLLFKSIKGRLAKGRGIKTLRRLMAQLSTTLCHMKDKSFFGIQNVRDFFCCI